MGVEIDDEIVSGMLGRSIMAEVVIAVIELVQTTPPNEVSGRLQLGIRW